MTKDYTDDLLLRLRLRDVPGPRIGEIIAEIESHVAETGQHPVDVFGTPAEYAAALAPKPNWLSPHMWVRIILGGTTGYAIATTVISWLLGEETALGMPIWLAALVSLALASAMTWAVGRGHDDVVDPRTGDNMIPSAPRATVVVLVVIAAAAAAVAIGLLALK